MIVVVVNEQTGEIEQSRYWNHSIPGFRSMSSLRDYITTQEARTTVDALTRAFALIDACKMYDALYDLVQAFSKVPMPRTGAPQELIDAASLLGFPPSRKIGDIVFVEGQRRKIAKILLTGFVKWEYDVVFLNDGGVVDRSSYPARFQEEDLKDVPATACFKVGDRVSLTDQSVGTVNEATLSNGIWVYTVELDNGEVGHWNESLLVPGPKYKVGEWVMDCDGDAVQIKKPVFRSHSGWAYGVVWEGMELQYGQNSLSRIPQPDFAIGDYVQLNNGVPHGRVVDLSYVKDANFWRVIVQWPQGNPIPYSQNILKKLPAPKYAIGQKTADGGTIVSIDFVPGAYVEGIWSYGVEYQITEKRTHHERSISAAEPA